MSNPSPPPPPPPDDRYVDPVNGARWRWDGRRWIPDGPVPSASPGPPPAATRNASRNRSGCLVGITFAGVVAVVFAGMGLALAITRGQDVSAVDPGSGRIEFYSSSQASGEPDSAIVEDIRSSQDVLTTRVDALEQEARAEVGEDVDLGIADFSGLWLGANGLTYSIRQFGDAAVIEEQSTFGTTAVGEGTVSGETFDFDFESFDGSFGRGTLTMSEPGFLSGTFVNDLYGQTTPATMERL